MTIDEAFNEILNRPDFQDLARKPGRYQQIKHRAQFPGEVKWLAKVRLLIEFGYVIEVKRPSFEGK